ncbi:MAG TPA: MBL fold metallo-hydrolase, partial [Ignavibacteriaceae bacterium]|nr:MBL fold metallo-hydrolase [Ignavibacteriaceae bacterium]
TLFFLPLLKIDPDCSLFMYIDLIFSKVINPLIRSNSELNIKFLALGAAREIGASCFYLNISGTGIILDCGIHPQKTGLQALPDFTLLESEVLDYVIISHAHQDHLSALPFLIKKFPYVKIFTTPQTRALAELVLHDSISILKNQINNDEFEIYSHEEIDLLIQSIEYKSYYEEFVLYGYAGTEPITAIFYDAGHILGSAGILLETPRQKLFYTGDINLSNQALLKGAELPDKKIDTLLLESTYGSTDSSIVPDWNNEAIRLASEINMILNKGGSILIPAFSLGKTQEIIATIWKLIEKGKIPAVDIYTGGIAEKISRVYDYNRYAANMNEKDFEILAVPHKNLYEVENINDFFKNFSIIIASSGMMIEGTASFNLGLKWLSQVKSAIFTVGYMEQSTPGYKFAKAKKGDILKFERNNKEEIVRCTIKNFRFPSHARREQLLETVKALDPETVILVHGETDSIEWMTNKILNETNGNKIREVIPAEIGKEIFI